MWHDALEDPNRDVRRHAWGALHERIANHTLAPDHNLVEKTAAHLFVEADPEIHRLGVTVLLACLVSQRRGRPTSSPPSNGMLSDWFWKPFHRNSAVFRVVDPIRRRDEDGFIELARFLSKERFPNAQYLRVSLGAGALGKLFEQRKLRAALLGGRLGLYGPEVIEAFSPTENTATETKNRRAFPPVRFYFPQQDRPPHLRPGEVDAQSRYHCICERTQGGSDIEYRAFDRYPERTDFAVVQRYRCYFQTMPLTVVVAAGCSSLGTLAALTWAAELEAGRIPAPHGLTDDAVLEALLEVKADIAAFPNSWVFNSLRIVKLLAGAHEWQADSRKWQTPAADRLDVICRQGQVVDIRDGHLRALKRGSSQFNALLAICELAQQNGGTVPLDLLRKHRLTRKLTPRQLSQSLHRLRERLGAGITVTNEHVSLNLTVVREESP